MTALDDLPLVWARHQANETKTRDAAAKTVADVEPQTQPGATYSKPEDR